MPGIQFIGTQRSGTNLLRLMLDQMPEIHAPHPPHLLINFLPLLPFYEPLSDEMNFRKLVQDIVRYVTINPVPWDFIPDADAVIDRCSEHTLEEVFHRIYEWAAEKKGSTWWCCKSVANVHHAHLLERQMKPVYLFLYRDGRDVALSFQKAVVGDKHIYHLARQWQEDQEAALKLAGQVPSERFISVSYEHLLADPEGQLKQLCETLAIPYSPAALDYYKSQNSARTAESGEMWKNVTKPVIRDNQNKFLREMSTEELNIFESVAGDTLKKLGYNLYSKSPLRVFSDHEIEAFDRINRDLKAGIRASIPQEDLEKRRGQEELLSQIKLNILK